MKKATMLAAIVAFLFQAGNSDAQNKGILSKVKVYFNHPVDTKYARGVNATYVHNAIMDTIAAYINRAKYTVDIAQYDYTAYSGDTLAHIATAVNNAYARGVKIRWICDGSSPNSGLSLLNSSIPTLASPTGSNYGISHNKFVVIDEYDSLNAIVSDGSEDWSQEMDDDDYNNLVFIQSKVLARAFTNEFNIMWGDTTHGAASNSTNSKFGIYKPNSGTHIFNIGGSQVDLYFSPSDGTNTQVINTINSANTDMYCGMYDFTQTQYSTPFVSKANGGVYAACILDQYSVGSSAYTAMSGISNFVEYTGKYIYHNKFITVDPSNPCSDPQVLTGSMNWTGAGYDENDENIIIIHNDTIANMYLQSFADDFETIGTSKLDTMFTYCAVGIPSIDEELASLQVYPNPYNGSTTIKYTLPSEENVTAEVYDIMGQKVCTLAGNQLQQGGEHTYQFSGFGPGIYILKLQAGQSVRTQKLVQVN